MFQINETFHGVYGANTYKTKVERNKYMKKRIIAISVTLVMLLGIVALTACGDDSSGGDGIILVNNKVEIDAQLKAFAAIYEEQFGIHVDVRSFGGETPYAPALSAMLNAGTEPDIFVFEGTAGWEDARELGQLTDLSNEPWVSDTDVAFHDPIDGNIVGFPVAIEGWGLGYNKALLAQAGIDPNTLTNANTMRDAFVKIDGMKDELGIEAVVSMAAGPGMTWVTGLHGVNAYLTLGLPYDDANKYIDMMLNGQVDHDRLFAWGAYYQMLMANGIQNTVLNGGYDQQLGDFAVGKTVFIHQGNWTDPTFAELGVTFEMGYVPHAFLPEDTDGIFVGAPSFYLVNAKGNVDAAKEFLRYMASSPAGHNYMVTEAGMVPAFKSVTLKPPGQFSIAVQEWANAGKIYAWKQNDMPSGFGMDTLGPIFEEMAAERIDLAGFIQKVTAAVAAIR